jgi:hypothetical protein
VFFLNIVRFLSYWTFNPLGGLVAPPLIRVEKNYFFKIVRKGYQKKRNFALISKMCRSLEFSKREKVSQKNRFFRKLAKKLFSVKKSLGTILDARDLHIFENSVKFCFF